MHRVPTPPLLQQQPALLRQFGNSLVEGIAGKPCPHIHEVFETLLDAAYIGLEVVLSEKHHTFALYQHNADALGFWLVPPVPHTLPRNLPLSIKGPPDHADQALVRIPMLCDEQALAALMLADNLCDTWFDQAQHAPVVGSLLLATSKTHASNHIHVSNALVLAAHLAPLLIRHARHRLLLVALSASALPAKDLCGGDVVYIPGKGFVSDQGAEDTRQDADVARLMRLLDGQGQAAVDADQAQPGDNESDHGSSSGSMDSVNNGEPLEEHHGGAASQSKRQRCADDAHSWVVHDREGDDDEDEEEEQCGNSGAGDGSGADTSGSSLQHSAAGNTEDNVQASSNDNKTHTQQAATLQRLQDGLQYADAETEEQFMVFMHHDIALLKRCFLATLFFALGWRWWHIVDSGSAPWDVQAMTALATFNAGFMAIVHSLPIHTARQARIKELCVFVFYVLVGVPNAVLHCRYCLYQMSNASWTRPQAPASSLEGWQLMVVLLMLLFFSASRRMNGLKFAGLAAVVASSIVTFIEEMALVLDGKHLVHRTLPCISILAVVSNGGVLRFLRHTWARRVSKAKYIAMLLFLATTALTSNPAPPWWALAAVALLAHVILNLTNFALALEVEQRARFEHTVLCIPNQAP